MRNRTFIPNDGPFLGVWWLLGLALLLVACGTQSTEPTGGSAGSEAQAGGERYSDLEIVTLLPRDAIPAIDSPKFISASEAGLSYAPDELVLGVDFNGETRAYSIPLLSSHEIVNDTVGGVKIAVTW